jgi:anti-sigma factor RsiW
MMVVKRIAATPGMLAMDCVGAAQTILVWDRGVCVGRVAAAQSVLDGHAIDLVVAFEQPAPVEVPEDVCSRVESCRFDLRCPFWDTCARHVHGPDCGGCES